MLALLGLSTAALRTSPLPVSTLAPAVSRPVLLPRGMVGEAHTPRSRVVQMFELPTEPPEEDDVFEELISELTSSQKLVKALPRAAVKATSISLPLLLGLVGWVLAPMSMGRFGTVIGAATGSVGYKAGQKVRQIRRGVVPAAIAEMIQEVEGDLKKLDPEEVAELAGRFGVGEEQFEEQLIQVYGRFLRELLQEDTVAASQVSQLGTLRKGLGLDWNATRTAHALEAEAMVDGNKPPSAAATSPALKKLVWLSMTLFATNKKVKPSDTKAIEEALGLARGDLDQLVSQLSTPLYRAAITQAVGKYNATETPVVLQTVRSALCLSEQAVPRVERARDPLLPPLSRPFHPSSPSHRA